MLCLCLEGTDSDSDDMDLEDGARIRATRKSRDLREKLKKKAQVKKAPGASSEEEEDGSEEEGSKHEKIAAESPTSRKKRDEVKEKESKGSLIKPATSQRSSSLTPEQTKPQTSPRSMKKKKLSENDSDHDTGTLLQKKSQHNLRDKDQHSDYGSSPHRRSGKLVGSGHKDVRNGGLSDGTPPPQRRKRKIREQDSSQDRGESTDEGSRSSRHRSRGNVKSKSRVTKRKVEEASHSPLTNLTKSSPSPRHAAAVGSDLSSGDDFNEIGNSHARSSERRHRPATRKRDSDEDGIRRRPNSPVRSRRRPQTPDFPADEPDWRGGGHPRTPPLSDKPDHSDLEEGRSGVSIRDTARNNRKIPRRYQGEAGGETAMSSGSRREGMGNRYREQKEAQQERRYHGSGPQGSSPSPPPHMNRRKYHHSPVQQGSTENLERKRRRARGYSPGSSGNAGGGGGAQGGGFRRRRSPGFQSPSFRVKSPYGGSPPHRYYTCFH